MTPTQHRAIRELDAGRITEAEAAAAFSTEGSRCRDAEVYRL